jgi:2-hydroxychromene-2-carboxylate isomerase
MALARQLQARVEVMPVELETVFAATGGRPFAQRSAPRQSYRQLELARWSDALDVPLTLQPRFYPVDRTPASCLLISTRQAGLDALGLSHRVLRAIWCEERDIADWTTLGELIAEAGLPPELLEDARSVGARAQFVQDTERAISESVFGAPTYVVEGERFWGQDRLDFLEARLTGLRPEALPAARRQPQDKPGFNSSS